MSKPEPSEDFYQHVNHDWLNSPDAIIPAEYPRWGGFIKLHDTGLKNQIQLVKELYENSDKKALSESETKILAIWSACQDLFNEPNPRDYQGNVFIY